MNIREEIIKNMDTLREEDLEGVLDYIRVIQEPEAVEPTAEEIAIIARGKGHRDIRFKPNLIVDFLVDKAGKLGFDLNDLHGYTFPQEDWEQFYQLMGYSVDGYHELSHVSD